MKNHRVYGGHVVVPAIVGGGGHIGGSVVTGVTPGHVSFTPGNPIVIYPFKHIPTNHPIYYPYPPHPSYYPYPFLPYS